MKKATALVLTSAMALSLLAGCGGSSSSASTSSAASGATAEEATTASSTASGEQVTLQVSLWDYTTTTTYSDVVALFEEANPDIKVEVIDVPAADYTTKLSVMLNGGSDLDVFFIKDADTIRGLIDKGQCLDLSDYIAADGYDLSAFNGLGEAYNVDGAQYALPFRTDYYVMYYNKAIFDAANIDYPSNDWTWDEFEQLAGQLTSGEGTNKTYGAHFHTWQACVENWGVQDGKHTIMDYDTGYDFFKPYYEMVLRMQDAGSIMDYGTLTSGNIHYASAFVQGNIAMMPMGTWYMATIIESNAKGESNIDWGIATLPHAADVEAGYTVGSTTPIAINKASAKQDAAWKFVKFVTDQTAAEAVAATGVLPARVDDTMLATIASIEGMPDGAAEALQVKNISLDRPIEEGVSEVNQMLGEEHQLIMLEQTTLDDGLNQMAERAAEIVGNLG